MAFRIFKRLQELLDVDTSGAADGDALTFDSGTGKWVPAAGGGGGVTDHGALTGLGDDDHTQYHTDARGDARYSQLGHAHSGADITSGTVADARIASTIARDSEVTAAVSASEAGQVRDGDAAGGVLGGTYPNPSFAADMATQAELDAHAADTTSVHGIADTSALALTANHPTNATFNDHSARHEDGGADEISIAGLDGTPTELTNHLNDATDAHDASAISVLDTGGNFTATDVEGALEELAGSVGGGGPPTGAAGGVLDGTYPNPGLAASVAGAGLAETTNVLSVNVDDSTIEIASDTLRIKDGGVTAAKVASDVATQAELDAHINDTTDAHDASAISIADAGGDFTATDVEGALDELQADHEADAQALADHIADATAAHAASAVSVSSATLSGTGTDVQAVFEEIDNLLDDHSARHEDGGADEISIQGLAGTPVELTNHLNDTSDAHDASAISSVAAGNLAATDVQAALNELDTEKQPVDADLTAIAGLSPSNDDVIQRKAGAWTNRTIAQLLADLAAPGTTFQPLDADLTAIAALATAAAGRSVLVLTDPNADRIGFWDDSAGAFAWLELGTNLSITGTTLNASGGGGGGSAITKDVAQAGHGLSVGNAVRLSGTSYVKAQANSAANAEVVGVVSAVADTDNFTLTMAGRVTGLSGLTAGTVYYLDDDTAGLLTATEPPDAGDISMPVLVADTTTSGYVIPSRGAKVIAPTGQLWLSGAGMWPSTTSGAGANTKTEYGTNDVDLYNLPFDQTAQEFAQATVAMPSDWDGGTVTAKVYWTKDGTNTNSVVWGVQGRSYGDGDAIDQAWGTAQEVTDAGLATDDAVHISGSTAAITLAGTPAAGELVQFRVYRDPADGSDTFAADALLLGVMITYTKAI